MNKEEIAKKKIKQNCPICNYSYAKKYISFHIKNQHPNSEYSKIIRRGVKYNLKNNCSSTTNAEKQYCKICKKLIKKKCFSAHLKTFLHKKLLESIEGNKKSEKVMIIFPKTPEKE